MSADAGRPKAGHFQPKKGRPGRTGSSRTIGAAYTGATPFRQCGRVAESRFFQTSHLARIIQFSRCITLHKGMRARLQAGCCRDWTMLLPNPAGRGSAWEGSGAHGFREPKLLLNLNLTAPADTTHS